uniref:Uncharacterized protein n=1 Tax=Shewanella decolorationis TaxID=256839 RepID=A0A8A9LES5_9GAMM
MAQRPPLFIVQAVSTTLFSLKKPQTLKKERLTMQLADFWQDERKSLKRKYRRNCPIK